MAPRGRHQTGRLPATWVTLGWSRSDEISCPQSKSQRRSEPAVITCQATRTVNDLAKRRSLDHDVIAWSAVQDVDTRSAYEHVVSLSSE